MSRLAEVGRDARVAAYLAGRDGVEAEEQRAVWCRLQQEWQRREAWRRRAGVAVRFSWTTLRQKLSRLGPAGSQWKSEVVEDEVRAGWVALWWRVVRRRSTWRGPFWGSFGRFAEGACGGWQRLCCATTLSTVLLTLQTKPAGRKVVQTGGGGGVAGHLSNRCRGRGGDVVVLKRHRGWVARRSSSTRTWSRVEVG